jgi:hypothetical protein
VNTLPSAIETRVADSDAHSICGGRES